LPSQETGFWRTLGPSIELNGTAFLCVECGSVWTQADKIAAAEELSRRGNDELLQRLRLTARPKRRWRWLLFGTR
jgi:hypothetical protein